MIDWNAFYANGGYYGENDPQCYDDGYYEEFDEEDSEEEKEEDELYPMKAMDKEAYEIKKDGMTRAERRAYNVCWRNKRKQTHGKRSKNTDFGCN